MIVPLIRVKIQAPADSVQGVPIIKISTPASAKCPSLAKVDTTKSTHPKNSSYATSSNLTVAVTLQATIIWYPRTKTTNKTAQTANLPNKSMLPLATRNSTTRQCASTMTAMRRPASSPSNRRRTTTRIRRYTGRATPSRQGAIPKALQLQQSATQDRRTTVVRGAKKRCTVHIT